jgi:hypothetical protein
MAHIHHGPSHIQRSAPAGQTTINVRNYHPLSPELSADDIWEKICLRGNIKRGEMPEKTRKDTEPMENKRLN